MKIQRNAPCPCGSGKKYKKCCLLNDQTDPDQRPKQDSDTSAAQQQSQGLSEAMMAMAQTQGADINELNLLAAQAQNQEAQEDFAGLNSKQMSSLLSTPFDCEQVLRFSKQWQPQCSFLTLFDKLVAFIGEGKVKATDEDNLPLKWCKEIFVEYKRGLLNTTRGISSEEDFLDLHSVRLSCELAGILQREKGEFSLTQKYFDLKGEKHRAELVMLLFRTYIEKFNWGYNDGYAELPNEQRFFAFSLYLLQKFGDQPRPSGFYCERFIQALPPLLSGLEPDKYLSPEKLFSNIYYVRTLMRFAHFFGLIVLKSDPKAVGKIDYFVEKTPALDSLFSVL